MKGTLTLIPTPIDDESSLCPSAFKLLQAAIENNDTIYVEELKVARRRWIKYGLPREAIDNFKLYNEHTYKESVKEALGILKSGKNIFLMSDCGLPAFCDPGRRLVEACHKSRIKVTSSPFANSIALAISLSGFPHDRFIFEGFLPASSDTRPKELKRVCKQKEVSVIMDTPYRLNKLLSELSNITPKREAFIGLDLNQKTEELYRDTLKALASKIEKSKREFILILGPLDER